MVTIHFFKVANSHTYLTIFGFDFSKLPVTDVHTPLEWSIQSDTGTVDWVFTSSPADPFAYTHVTNQHYVPIGGTIVSWEIDTNHSPAVKISGFAWNWASGSGHPLDPGENMTVIGSPYNDLLTAAGANATINGGAGNDTIVAGPGNDHLTGGPGHDIFYFSSSFGHDVITDFTPGQDRIAISHLTFANVAAVKAHSQVDAHGHVIIEVNASETITLDTLHHVNQLMKGDFLFF